jgi:hypothetical protein
MRQISTMRLIDHANLRMAFIPLPYASVIALLNPLTSVVKLFRNNLALHRPICQRLLHVGIFNEARSRRRTAILRKATMSSIFIRQTAELWYNTIYFH